MKTTTVSLANLKPLDRNPRKHSKLQIAELKRSVEMFGQIRPLVVDEGNNVLAGNGLLIALTELGWTKGEAYLVKDLSEDDKKRLILADNKVAALGTDDYAVIEELIFELRNDLNIPGFDDDVLRSLVAAPAQLKEIGDSYGVIDQSFKEHVQQKAAAVAAEGAEKDRIVQEMTDKANSTLFTVCDSCGQKVWS
tara:strand:- start:967 stop:1548 length:582 start_codon:yes stop_codon:yes gene_type:complete